MKNKVSISDFLILMSWVKVYQFFEFKRFDYQEIMDKIENLYNSGAYYFDTSDNNIDELMSDAYKIYSKIIKSKSIFNMIDKVSVPFFDKDSMIQETKKYEKVIEYMMMNIEYKNVEIRSIQKDFLTGKMKECVDIEDYENAAKFRDLIKEC